MTIMTMREQFLARKKAEFGDKWDASDLDERFFKYYFNKDRIKVQDESGEILTGTVGITTGWKPAFLLMHSIRSHGSSVLLGKYYKIIGIKAAGKKKFSSP